MIVFILVILLVFLIVRYTVGVSRFHSISVTKTLNIETLKSGDILTLSYRDPIRHYLGTLATGSLWLHTAVVFKDEEKNEVFVLESSIYKPEKYRGVIQVPINDWIGLNRRASGFVCGLVRINIPAPGVKNAFERLRALKVGVQWFDIGWIRFLFSKTPETVSANSFFSSSRLTPPDKNSTEYKIKNWLSLRNRFLEADKFDYLLTCGEVAIEILKEAGVLDTRLTPCSYFPADLVERRIPTKKPFAYSAVEKFRF